MNKSCLIIDEMHPGIIPLMEEIGYLTDYKPQITRKEIIEIISSYTGMLVRSKTNIDKEIIDAATNLKFVGRAGAGVDQLDTEELKKKGIIIVNAPEGNCDAVAEHCIGMILNLLNKMRIADQQVRNFTWDREGNRGLEINEKTVGIIGYGYMGKAFAKRLSSFGCKVIAYDKYKKNFSDQYVQEVALDEIFNTTDILSLHVPLTSETRGFINESFLNNFKKAIFLLNTARGEILSIEDLLKALEDGRIKGAALDVLENEKLDKLSVKQKEVFETLFNSDKVLLTPHVAGWTVESYIKINEILVEKIKHLNI